MAEKAMDLPQQPGTYILLLQECRGRRLQIGQLGPLRTREGYYLYVGSAFGPGGLRARVARHLRDEKSPHWHIDYLAPQEHWLEVWFTVHPRPVEHRTAGWLADGPGLQPARPGFGTSDCRCRTHLFFSPLKPTLEWLEGGLRDQRGQPLSWVSFPRGT